MPDVNYPLDYTISNIRFEPEVGGYVTIWFDLGGQPFAEPEAMANMFIEFEALLDDIAREYPALYAVLADGPQEHGILMERLEAAGFDWPEHLRGYIDRHVDLPAAEKERTGWLLARRERAAGPVAVSALDTEWERLSASAEPLPHPSWDDVAHALIDSLNATAVELYPELLDYDTDSNNRLRDMIESHGERLANQLYALTKSVREEQGK